jgi:hypothetical protein
VENFTLKPIHSFFWREYDHANKKPITIIKTTTAPTNKSNCIVCPKETKDKPVEFTAGLKPVNWRNVLFDPDWIDCPNGTDPKAITINRHTSPITTSTHFIPANAPLYNNKKVYPSVNIFRYYNQLGFYITSSYSDALSKTNFRNILSMLWQYVAIIEEWLADYSEIPVLIVSLITGIYFSIFSSIFFSLVTDFTKVTSLIFNIEIVIGGAVLVGLAIIIVWISCRNKKRTKDLEKAKKGLEEKVKELENDDNEHQNTILEIAQFINQYIGNCVFDFDGQPKKVDRISLYIRGEDGFFPIARYSANPEYSSIRRTRYPPKQGAIYKSWNNGSYYRTYPDPISHPDDYFAFLQKEENLPRQDAEEIQMKSRQIYGYRIGDDADPVGVFIIESLNVKRFHKSDLESAFNGMPEVKICIDILLKLDLPNPYIGETWEERAIN